jgi:hypothetical protein
MRTRTSRLLSTDDKHLDSRGVMGRETSGDSTRSTNLHNVTLGFSLFEPLRPHPLSTFPNTTAQIGDTRILP